MSPEVQLKCGRQKKLQIDRRQRHPGDTLRLGSKGWQKKMLEHETVLKSCTLAHQEHTSGIPIRGDSKDRLESGCRAKPGFNVGQLKAIYLDHLRK